MILQSKVKKLQVFLVDASIEASKIESLVLGVGINFKINSAQLEKSLKNTENFYGIASLNDSFKNESPSLLVKSFLYEMEKILELLEKGKRKNIIKDWTKKSSTIGKKVSLSISHNNIKGKAVKLDNDGALVINTDGRLHRILAGDLTYSKH